MNKSKAKRLRKELEHEQRLVDRGHAVQLKRITERRRRQDLAMVQLTPVQKAVHFDENA